jgi:hypothetical protein
MNHQEYVLSIIKKKFSITQPPVRAILNHALTSAQYRGLYVEFKPKKNKYAPHYKLFINDNVGDRSFHNAPGILCVPDIANCLWFKEHFDTIKITNCLVV